MYIPVSKHNYGPKSINDPRANIVSVLRTELAVKLYREAIA